MAVGSSANRNIIMHPLLLRMLWTGRFFIRALLEGSSAFLRFQPGYHGSTIPSAKFIRHNRDRLFGPPELDDGIDYNREKQKALLEKFIRFYPDFNPSELPTQDRLYHYDNGKFTFPDAFILYSMFREFRPNRVIEVGSGFSSALMLDISQEFLPNTRFTFIDPYSTTIQDVLVKRPPGDYELLRTEVQDVDLEVFRQLESGDVLFLDTSHTLKIGSDVSTHLFRILPALKPGVIIHIHDIYFWEYPERSVMEGRTYNETYFVRAFLQYNNAFEILYHSAQMKHENAEIIRDGMPGLFKLEKDDCQSLWLRKVK